MMLDDIWKNSLSKIEERVGNNAIDLWFRPVKLSQLKEQQVTLDIPNKFFKDWIEDNYPDLLSETLGGVLGYPVTVRYRIVEKVDPDVRKKDMRLENRTAETCKQGHIP